MTTFDNPTPHPTVDQRAHIRHMRYLAFAFAAFFIAAGVIAGPWVAYLIFMAAKTS